MLKKTFFDYYFGAGLSCSSQCLIFNFFFHARWYKYLGNLPRGEEQAWPEVWHSLPIDGLCLRCILRPSADTLPMTLPHPSFVREMHHSWGSAFFSFCLVGEQARTFFLQSGLPASVLAEIWWDAMTQTFCVFLFMTNNFMVFNGSIHLCVPGLWLIWIKMERWTGWSFPLPWSSSSWNSRVLRFHQHCQSSWSSLLYLPPP